jgi:2-oxoglutarate dehydrogenase E1 component
MTPKSLLRHPRVTSSFDDLAQGSFQRIIPDSTSRDPNEITRIILCTGKVFYDLEKHRGESKKDQVALLRLEQLYPLQRDELKQALARYKDGTPVLWVQEEPENMGAWRYLRVKFGENLFERFPFRGVSRPASASPATGSANSHKHEHARLLAEAFDGKK